MIVTATWCDSRHRRGLASFTVPSLAQRLIELDRTACSVPVDLERLYHRHRQRIQAAARRKHWPRKSEPGGEVLVESADLAIE